MNKIIDLINASRRPVVIASPAVIKKLAAALAATGTLRNVTYKTPAAAAGDICGVWRLEARLRLAFDLKVTPEHAEILLRNSLFARPGVNRKIDELCEIREKYKAYLDYSELVLNYYRGRDIIIVGDYGTDDLFNRARGILSGLGWVVDYAPGAYVKKKVPIYRFKDYKEEILALGLEVASLIDKGIKPDKIKIQKPPASYRPYFDEVFHLLGIELSGSGEQSLFEYEATKEIMTELDKRRDEPITEAFSAALSSYRPGENPVVSSLINIFNSYMAFDLRVGDIYDDLAYALSRSRLPDVDYRGAPLLADLVEEPGDEDDYLFVPVFNQDVFPKTRLDDDYLDDKEKKALGLLTSRELNRLEKIKALALIDRAKNLYLSYSLMAPDGIAVRSPLVMTIVEKRGGRETEYARRDEVSYSRELDIIELGKRLDAYYKYDVREERMFRLLAAYPDHPYRSYQNAFDGLEPKTYKKLFSVPFVISYTSLDKYFRCGFAFYLDKILKLYRPGNEETLYIGNLLHHCLEKLLSETEIDDIDAFLEESAAEYVNETGKQLTAREKYFVKKYRDILDKLYRFMQKQRETCAFSVYGLEKEFEVPLGDGIILKGKIDKIMTATLGEKTYAIVIDYKSGNTEVDLNNVVHGLDLQLPIYFYLLNNSGGEEFHFAGMYLQRVLPSSVFARKEGKTFEEQLREYFRLKGYTNGGESVLRLIDRYYAGSGFNAIAGLRVNRDGSIHKTDAARVMTEAEFSRLLGLVAEKIAEAKAGILAGRFPIEPKRHSKFDSCQYCPYRDICFREEADYKELEIDKNLDFIREAQ